MARTRERKTVTLCALETAQCFDAVTAWVVCVIAERIEVLSGGLGVDVVLETAGHLTRSVGHCEAQRKPGRFYLRRRAFHCPYGGNIAEYGHIFPYLWARGGGVSLHL